MTVTLTEGDVIEVGQGPVKGVVYTTTDPLGDFAQLAKTYLGIKPGCFREGSTAPPSTLDHEAVRAQINRLETLGSPAHIAEFFRREGVKGYRTAHKDCIIARWLRDTCGGEVSVGGFVGDLRAGLLVAQLPSAVQQFIGGFDAGLYPELIA